MTKEVNLFDNLADVAPAPTSSDLTFDFEYTPAEIKVVGKEALEATLVHYVEKYKNYVVTAETFEEDAKIRANLNTLQRTIKSAVKDKLADYNKPIDEIKKWIDDLLKPIEDVKKSIDEGVKEFEERERLKRVETIKGLFQGFINQSGRDIDVLSFSHHFDEFSKKGHFMADNIRPKKATVDTISGIVAEEVAKQKEYENALIQITEAAAKADFGPASYVRSFKQGASLADILQAIVDDKALADKDREEEKRRRELAKRIEEMTAIASGKGLNPAKYIQMLKSGASSLVVHEELVNDARQLEELATQQQAVQNEQEQIAEHAPNRQNSNEIERENTSEGEIYRRTKNTTEAKIEPNKKIVKWQGDFKITFPDAATAKLFGGEGGLYDQHGVAVEKLGDWVKL